VISSRSPHHEPSLKLRPHAAGHAGPHPAVPKVTPSSRSAGLSAVADSDRIRLRPTRLGVTLRGRIAPGRALLRGRKTELRRQETESEGRAESLFPANSSDF